MGNVSAKGQATAFHGGLVYFMKGIEKSQELALRTVTSMVHKTDHTLCSLGERERGLRDGQACPGIQGLRAHQLSRL